MNETANSKLRHVGLKDIENVSYLNNVFQLFSNLIPNIIEEDIQVKNTLSLHMNNLITELWRGSEEYFVAWDLIKLFKLNY